METLGDEGSVLMMHPGSAMQHAKMTQSARPIKNIKTISDIVMMTPKTGKVEAGVEEASFASSSSSSSSGVRQHWSSRKQRGIGRHLNGPSDVIGCDWLE